MKIALLGNPNTGKSSVFNMLTGLKQHVGNFPGVTVDKKFGDLHVGNASHLLVDFPGTYSIYPRSKDEQVVYDVLSNPTHLDFPDAVIIVVDASNLERNLFLFSQIYDLGIPSILVLNMTDLAKQRGKSIDLEGLQAKFPKATIVETTARIGLGKQRLLQAIERLFIEIEGNAQNIVTSNLCAIEDDTCREAEATRRFAEIKELLATVEKTEPKQEVGTTSRVDRILVHPVYGYFLFALVLLVIFQFIYSFAALPMDFIDGAFSNLSSWFNGILPPGLFSDLVSQGIIPGIGGVVIFVPQIALLFFFIALLEESGYLARVVFIMDRLMRPLGLNGKSVVPLISSVACAIPGVMAARTISDWKERMITILVSPLMSCSARIPVYTVLIALVIPNERIFGFIHLQGLVLFGLYSLGLVAALLISLLLKTLIRSSDKGFLLLELPSYKAPRWGNVGLTVWEKVKVFVLSAGKIILAISIILWALATFGPSDKMTKASNLAREKALSENLDKESMDRLIAAAKLENSYIGRMGKTIEPMLLPLGYDWKIGISLITSFAAREVFVGSLATIYAVQEEADGNRSLIERMRAETKADGTPLYSLASGVSLMIFYVFAMQCMATMAVVKRETKSWKWPLIQLGFMGILAYLGAFTTYFILS
jgi:ferrous iron transport protein B